MILSIFVALMALSLAIVALGHYARDDTYTLTGYLFLFLLGTYLFSGLSGGLEIKIGENTSVAFNYNANNTTVVGAEELKIDIYEERQFRTFGIFLSLASSLAFVITLAQLRRERGEPSE